MPDYDPKICEMRFAQIENEAAEQSVSIHEQLAAILLEQKEQNKHIIAIQQKVFNGINERISMLNRIVWWLLGIASTATIGVVLALLSRALAHIG